MSNMFRFGLLGGSTNRNAPAKRSGTPPAGMGAVISDRLSCIRDHFGEQYRVYRLA